MPVPEQVRQMLAALTPEQRYQVFRLLRREFPIHPIERKLDTEAEIILEAIDRASDLTLRGIRGVIAEAAFATDVVGRLDGWQDVTPAGDAPYDFLLRDSHGEVRVQVKLQRQRAHRPMLSDQTPRWAGLPPGMFVVETQRTRGGTTAGGEDTRPYRFGEFDLLAVSLHPSTRNWSSFVYTVADWLVPHPENAKWIQKYQAVPSQADVHWTDDFLQAVTWFRSGERRPLPFRR